MTNIAGSGSRIRIQDPDPNPDPLVRDMDPRFRIQIHPKMSWIRNTAGYQQLHFDLFVTIEKKNMLLHPEPMLKDDFRAT
jgi:hypothetical protein